MDGGPQWPGATQGIEPATKPKGPRRGQARGEEIDGREQAWRQWAPGSHPKVAGTCTCALSAPLYPVQGSTVPVPGPLVAERRRRRARAVLVTSNSIHHRSTIGTRGGHLGGVPAGQSTSQSLGRSRREATPVNCHQSPILCSSATRRCAGPPPARKAASSTHTVRSSHARLARHGRPAHTPPPPLPPID